MSTKRLIKAIKEKAEAEIEWISEFKEVPEGEEATEKDEEEEGAEEDDESEDDESESEEEESDGDEEDEEESDADEEESDDDEEEDEGSEEEDEDEALIEGMPYKETALKKMEPAQLKTLVIALSGKPDKLGNPFKLRQFILKKQPKA
jgi:hypothetical protein